MNILLTVILSVMAYSYVPNHLKKLTFQIVSDRTRNIDDYLYQDDEIYEFSYQGINRTLLRRITNKLPRYIKRNGSVNSDFEFVIHQDVGIYDSSLYKNDSLKSSNESELNL